MQYTDYLKYTISTIESYPYKSRKHLRALFVDAGIAQEDAQFDMMQPNATDISGLDLNQQLIHCIEQQEKSFGIIERWEFEKDYKYSVLFTSDEFGKLLSCIEASFSPYNEDKKPLYGTLENPCFLDLEKILLLKFNLKFEAIHPLTAEELFTRYPIVVALHKQEQLVEIRFDALKRFFMEAPDTFYSNLVSNVCNYIEKQCGTSLSPLDLDFLIDRVQHDDVGVHLVAQTMRMSNGTYAELQVSKNEDYLLPFIGELKNLLIENSSEFAKVPSLQEAFEQFIFEKEATSDYPWIELLWENEIKTRSIHVKFTFNYYQKGYCLLQHYFNSVLIGMERMNYVISYIDCARKNL